MLTSLSIGNFKAFGETQTIPIRPLTLIFGANSAGKSSIIHSLLLANHALANGNFDVHQPRLAGESVDLGGFREFVYQHRTDWLCRLCFTVKHDPYHADECFSSFRRTAVRFELGVLNHDTASSRQSGATGVMSFTISVDDSELLRIAPGADGYYYVQKVNFENPCFTPFLARINRLRPPESPYRQPGPAWQPPGDVEHSLENLERTAKMPADKSKPDFAAVREVALELRESMQKTLQMNREEDAAIRANFIGELRMRLETEIREVPLHPRNLVPVSARSPRDREAYSREAEVGTRWRGLEALDNLEFFDAIEAIFCFEMEELLGWISESVGEVLGSASYLGPLRSYPPRHLIGMHDQEPNWYSGGGHAWDVLRHDSDVVARVNDWFGIVGAGCQLTVRNLTDTSRLGDAERKALVQRLQTSDLAGESDAAAALNELLQALAKSPTATMMGEVVLLDLSSGTEVTHRDVGVGISQVLPVLVHSIADQNQIVAIEQPEIHLHPALQAELGDVFIESALGKQKNTFLVETHSEHLILRILRRIRETTADGKPSKDGLPPIRPEDVSVVYVQPGPKGAEVIELPVTPDGDFSRPWPKGFFAERAAELF